MRLVNSLLLLSAIGLAACGKAPPAVQLYDPVAASQAPASILPPSQTTPGPIPVAFRHVWAIDPRDCAREPALTRIAIAPGAIRFQHGRAAVTSAESSGDDTVLLDIEQITDGKRIRARHTLSLDPTRTRLIYLRDEESFIYVQCD